MHTLWETGGHHAIKAYAVHGWLGADKALTDGAFKHRLGLFDMPHRSVPSDPTSLPRTLQGMPSCHQPADGMQLPHSVLASMASSAGMQCSQAPSVGSGVRGANPIRAATEELRSTVSGIVLDQQVRICVTPQTGQHTSDQTRVEPIRADLGPVLF